MTTLLRWRLLVAAVLLGAACDSAPLLAQDQKHVLILWGGRPDLPVNIVVNQTIRATLYQEFGSGVDLRFEYVEDIDQRQEQLALRDFLRQKYASYRVDLIIGPTSTGSTMAMVPLVERAHVPLLSLAGAVVIVDPVRKWVFKIPTSDRMAVERVFQEYLLARGELDWKGRRVNPKAIRRTALFTVEGERDDICSIGQTVAAHDLCSSLRPYRKKHYMQAGVGHYGVFAGRRWANQIYPLVRNTILANE